ncbi:hypothetical protein [Rhizobium sp. BK491]|nr:hypothetical protein [Rhizobium sp. BK491]MBB3569289.1 hypothetical protein [Rhizobium sp. BK491]
MNERNPVPKFEVKMVLKLFLYAIGVRKGEVALKPVRSTGRHRRPELIYV